MKSTVSPLVVTAAVAVGDVARLRLALGPWGVPPRRFGLVHRLRRAWARLVLRLEHNGEAQLHAAFERALADSFSEGASLLAPWAWPPTAWRVAARAGNREWVARLLPRIDGASRFLMLPEASAAGHADTVEFVLRTLSREDRTATALASSLGAAAENDHVAVVAFLLQEAGPPPDAVQILVRAINRRAWRSAEALLAAVPPHTDTTPALEAAAAQGAKSLIPRLLPSSTPRANRSRALRWAAMHGHTEVVGTLVVHSDPLTAWSQVERELLVGDLPTSRRPLDVTALTLLSPYVPVAHLRAALQRLPVLEGYPEVRAVLLQHDLAGTLAAPVSVSSRARL